MPRPPSSTLFPYTTLFRSLLERQRRQCHLGQQFACQGAALGVVRADAMDQHRRERRRADRKSTRLNSSHTVISYAVFCLKKKKKKKKTHIKIQRHSTHHQS